MGYCRRYRLLANLFHHSWSESNSTSQFHNWNEPKSTAEFYIWNESKLHDFSKLLCRSKRR
jgi:hypothetical protein